MIRQTSAKHSLMISTKEKSSKKPKLFVDKYWWSSWFNSYAKVKDIFDLHPLLIEDIMNTGQRPKFEEFDNCLFLVLKMLRFDTDSKTIIAEQLSMVVSKSFLLTFQEKPGDVLNM